MLELYKNIKRYRLLNGWTQQELAERTGYDDRSSISKIEGGRVDLPQSAILKFASVFGIAPGELMGKDGVSASLTAGETELVTLFSRLDSEDQARILERMETMLEAEKYGKKGGSSEEKAIS